MYLLELFLIAVGLSMDAFAVSVCKGLALSKIRLRDAAVVGLWFGGFQAIMPLIGYFLGTSLEKYVTPVDHWIAFVLLAAIGVNMLREALSKNDGDDEADGSLAFKTMLVLALATSIDALAVGITLALLQVHIFPAVCFIGATTFILSMMGVKAGSVFGGRYKSRAELAGGAVLILIGLKILLDHLGVF
jgi:putative Mn2+ efflux pump MntP